jgi:hypothetical protein
MLLQSWRTSRVAYQLDRESGRYTRRIVRLGISLATSGFCAVERTREFGKLFFALYRWDGRIVFQAGKRSWNLDRTDLRLTYRRLDRWTSELTVEEAGAVTFRCSYRHPLRGLLVRRRDTEDDVDLERHHFLAHVAGRPLPARDSDAWEDGKAVEAEEAAGSGRTAEV